MMNRRQFLAAGTAAAGLAACGAVPEKRMAITMDDFSLSFAERLSPAERDKAILAAFEQYGIRAAGFVTGQNTDNEFGREVIARWQRSGHLIGNHCWSHPHASALTPGAFCEDIVRNDAYLSDYRAYKRNFRFPFLDEGATPEDRDAIRGWLAENGYRNAAVTIDSQDWSITERLEARLREDPYADVSAFGAFYTQHVVDLAEHYHFVALAMGLEFVPHTLLVHHNVLNGLFLRDVLAGLAAAGWSFLPAARALAHPFFDAAPVPLNGGRSLLDVLAQERGATVPTYPERGLQFGRIAMETAGL